ncbi:hypothetical protein XENTR_v10003663 [Xenopus tropicalis]|nr:hypothetical protein XENTR_v10003663 [Xenopus tropicalis]
MEGRHSFSGLSVALPFCRISSPGVAVLGPQDEEQSTCRSSREIKQHCTARLGTDLRAFRARSSHKSQRRI